MAPELKRRYYSIGDVSQMMGVKQHVLRFWENEFPILKPRKNRAGNRAYTERDIKIISLIRRLLYEERYSIEGAKKRLKGDQDIVTKQLAIPFEKLQRKSEIHDIRVELTKLIEEVRSL